MLERKERKREHGGGRSEERGKRERGRREREKGKKKRWKLSPVVGVGDGGW